MKLNLLSKLPALPFSLPEGKKKWLMLAGIAVLATAAISGGMLASKDRYVALFGSEQNLPVSQIVTTLDGEKQPYRIDPDNGQILVPEQALSKVRMLLAGKGIQALTPSGYELMDKDELLGSSQFIQNVRYKRSLEGEMAQSIMTMNPVKSARVHLALNEDSSFVVNNQPENSASVVLQLHYGMTLSPDQVNAIVHLVSTSVPGLKPANVSVVDQQGNLLSQDIADDALTTVNTRKRDRLLREIQDKTRASIDNMLTSLVGKGNFRVSVMPELDLSKVEETQERLGDTPKVNNEEKSDERSTDQIAIGVPGSLSNRPPVAPAAGQAAPNGDNAPQAVSQHTATKMNYNYDRDIRHIIHPGFEVKHLNVAVMLNKAAPAVKGLDKEQLDQIATMLNNAAGIDNARGDTLSVTMLNFTPVEKAPMIEEPVWKDPSLLAWARLAGIGLLALLILLLVVRPLLKQFSLERQKRLEQNLALAARDEDDEALPRIHPDEEPSERKTVELSFPGDEALPSASSGLETKLEFLQKLAINDTDRVADVIRQWITSNERVNNHDKQ
ncbi:flagellar basal-body MS-ring/collar protein FliF [Atlantibacter hermannii]|uniref:flagellar basal-body MS-ring/collar protein FliF n=1 Tax=Atlantibacter hermannii TaxID=565 RepID=UPI00289640C0|nr:flagellar basal-body MS-ring/collar protein FliF [Atlantibacter hermannii]MDU1952496.1 flagellar basal-body MS-ring/collar protein FliF [Atlantibacter hermannii]